MTRCATLRPPATLSVQVMFVLLEVSVSPPFGEVTVTAGRARPRSQTMVLSRTSLRVALAPSNGGSSALNSKDIWTWREGVPPQNEVEGLPPGAESSQRKPLLAGGPSLSSQT